MSARTTPRTVRELADFDDDRDSVTRDTFEYHGHDYRMRLNWVELWPDNPRQKPLMDLFSAETLWKLTEGGERIALSESEKKPVAKAYERMFETDKLFEERVREHAARYSEEGF